MNLLQIVQLGMSFIRAELPVLDAELANDGDVAGTAVARKVWLEAPSKYGTEPEKVLASAAFLEFRNYLRDGNANYPGAPDIPALGWGADLLYDFGTTRSAIHNFCNTGAIVVWAPVAAGS